MVTELAPLGSLRDLLRKEGSHTPIRELHSYLIQMTAGMAYMESKRFLHRDLAARNVLIGLQNRKRVIKIADFGLTTFGLRVLNGQSDCYIMREHKEVPFTWCAPESLKQRSFTTASDVWMFAVTMAEMFTFDGEPWPGLNGAEIPQKIDKEDERLEQPDLCPDEMYAIALKCWNADPSERPTFESLHTYFRSGVKIHECTATIAFDKNSPLPKIANGSASAPPPLDTKTPSPDLLSSPTSPKHQHQPKSDDKRKMMQILAGDRIQVIDGDAQHYYWKGQNQRSFTILGYFPRCVNNCGKRFYLEICSREFDHTVKRLLTKAPHVKVSQKLLQLINKWAESKDFAEDSQLNLIPTLYRQLKKEGYNFASIDLDDSSSPTSTSHKKKIKIPSDPNVKTSNEEEEDIAKAIAESLKVTTASASSSSSSFSYNNTSDSNSSSKSYSNSKSASGANSSSNTSSIYPTLDLNHHSLDGTSASITAVTNNNNSNGSKESYQVRALYDFEAAEDKELTFKAGEIVVIIDDTDKNWWKGSNHRGEGLFPANFVTSDLSDPALDPPVTSTSTTGKSGKSVQFNKGFKVKLLDHEADPTGEKGDSEELITLEEQVSLMAPLIDDELQKVDRNLASLNAVQSQLIQAMEWYHHLMKEGLQPQYYVPVSSHQIQYVPGQQQQQQQQQQPHGS